MASLEEEEVVSASTFPDSQPLPSPHPRPLSQRRHPSRLSQVVIPDLEKIIKNASWYKHSKLVALCKSLMETFPSLPSSPSSSSSSSSSFGPLHGGDELEYSLADAETILSPLVSACSSSFLKVTDPALDCVQKLISHAYLRDEVDPSGPPDARLLSEFIDVVCKCTDLNDDRLELLVFKIL